MADSKGGSELSWQTIVGALSAVAILGAAGWTIFQTQFANIEKELATDRARAEELQASLDKYLTIREHNGYRADVDNRVGDLDRRVVVLEASQAKAAREPVEAKTFEAVSKATDDRVTLLQNQLNDVNRQIAAALVIIDQNRGLSRGSPLPLPP
jgi:uncharacterized protein HemX